MKLFHIVLLLSSLCLAGCSGNGSGEITSLDLEKAIDMPRTFDLAEIARDIEFIPLDNSGGEALVGDIYMMAESRNGFYIVDRSYGNNPVKFYDRAGRFVATKGGIGHGPGEYVGVSYMTVDGERDNVYISSSGSIVAYDAAGRMFARNDSTGSAQTAFFDDRLISLNYPPTAPDADGKFTLVDIRSPGLRREGGIEVDWKGRVDLKIGFQTMSTNGRSLAIKEELSDTVFYYRPGGRLEPAFTMGLGRRAFKSETFDFAMMARWEEFYRVINIYEGERWVVVSLQNGLVGGKESIRTVVVDTGEAPQSGFSAVGGPDNRPGLFLDGLAFTPMYIRDNRLVGVIEAFDIADNAGKLSRPDLKALAAGLNEESNPIIAILTLEQ